MRVNRSWLNILILAVFLSGCAYPFGGAGNDPQPSFTPASLTPSLLPARTLEPDPSLTTTVPLPSKTRQLLSTDTPTPGRSVILEAVGDINLARTVGTAALTRGPQVIFSGVQPALDPADVLVGNLECALTARGAPQEKTFTFAAPPAAAEALSLAGFDVLGLANNHVLDYGASGLTDTQVILDYYGIAAVGAGADEAQAHRPALLTRNGLRLAFLAYVDVPVEGSGFNAHTWTAGPEQPGVAWADPIRIASDVAAAKEQADVVIVLLHSGYEITNIQPAVSANQQLEARAAIDAGAALVIGSHPHLLQSIESYHGGLIAYSLGNFVFDDYRGIANASIILRVVLSPDGVQSYDWLPVLIQDGLPVLTDLETAPAIGTLVAPIGP